MKVHKTIAFLCMVSCLLFAKKMHSQNVPEEIKSEPLYSHDKEIINGTKWIYYKKYRGIPFLAGRSWVTGDVWYDDKYFENIQLNYDLYTDEFIMFVPEEGKKKFVVVSKNHLQSFSFSDTVTGEKRSFEFLKLPGNQEKQLYEVAFKGRSVLLIRHRKKINKKISDGFLGDYVDSFKLYLKTGDQFETFSNKKSLLKILDNHIPELKRFIRKNNLRIKKGYFGDIAMVIEYFDQLESQ